MKQVKVTGVDVESWEPLYVYPGDSRTLPAIPAEYEDEVAVMIAADVCTGTDKHGNFIMPVSAYRWWRDKLYDLRREDKHLRGENGSFAEVLAEAQGGRVKACLDRLRRHSADVERKDYAASYNRDVYVDGKVKELSDAQQFSRIICKTLEYDAAAQEELIDFDTRERHISADAFAWYKLRCDSYRAASAMRDILEAHGVDYIDELEAALAKKHMYWHNYGDMPTLNAERLPLGTQAVYDFEHAHEAMIWYATAYDVHLHFVKTVLEVCKKVLVENKIQFIKGAWLNQ